MKRATKVLDEIKEKYRQNAGKDKGVFINLDAHSHFKSKDGSVQQAHLKTELMANLEKSGYGVALSEIDESTISQQDSSVDMNAVNGANTEQMQ